MSKSESKKPDKEIRIGGIKASIWSSEVEQDGRTVTHHSIRIQKRFKPKDGDWQDTDYYFPEDLPRLRLVIDKAFEFVSNLKDNSNNSEPA